MIEFFNGFNHCLFSFSGDEVFDHLEPEPEQLEKLQQNQGFHCSYLLYGYLSKSQEAQLLDVEDSTWFDPFVYSDWEWR